MAKSKADYWLTEDGLLLLSAWARNGLTDEQIANNMDISTTTLYNYKNQYTEIFNALKTSKELADIEVENALYKKALGYTVRVNEQKITKDGDVIDTERDIHIPADTTAQIFWLKNRKPKDWRDKQQDDLDKQGDTINIIIGKRDMTDAD